MRIIHLLDKGETLNKVNKQYGRKNLLISNDKIFNRYYVCINNNDDSVILVNNYRPIYEYTLNDDESTLDVMARGFEISGNPYAGKGETVILSKPKSIRYIVKPTDNLTDIANKFGVNVDDIVESNNLNTEKLFVGQVLWI